MIWLRTQLGLGIAILAAGLLPQAEAGKARDYLNAPKDTWVTFFNVAYSESVTPAVGGSDVFTAGLQTNIINQSIILTRIMDFWGRTGGISLIAPYTIINGKYESYEYKNHGLGDFAFAWETNLFGAPAMTRKEMQSWRPGTFSSFHLVVGTPIAHYQSSEPINTGSNRWTITPTINYSYTFDEGWTWIDGYLSGRFFTDNNNPYGGGVFQQKPVMLMEVHVSRNMHPKFWVSADTYYNLGGETSQNGVEKNNAANTLRVGVGAGLRVWTGGQLMFNYDGVAVRPEGQPNSQMWRLTLSQVW